jgi:small subunit ribosomal protein S18
LSNGKRTRSSQREGRRGSRQRYNRRTVCTFCADKIDVIDYKRADLLRRFITNRGKIKRPHKTGTCAKHQRLLAVAIKRARHLALLPYVAEHLRHS